MAQRFIEPIARIFTNAGAVGAGYKYYFYLTGTTTPVTTYQNAGLTVANTNPVLSDANGRFPEIWYSNLSQLKLIVKDSLNNTVETVDPVGASASAISLNDFDVRPTSYWGLTAGTSTAYTLIANPTISSYDNTQTFVVQVHVDCGASPTLAIDGLSAFNWKKYTQQGTKTALKANDLRANQRYFCINDGIDIVCLNPNLLPMLSGSDTALTIATGIVTLSNNSSSYVLDTEGAAATDDLVTINGGQDGQIIFIKSTADARNIILKHATGNIFSPQYINAATRDITLELATDFVMLRYNSTLAYWIVVSSSFNTFFNSKTTNGYSYLPNGVIIQWGLAMNIAGKDSVYVTLPVTYPIANLFCISGIQGNNNTIDYPVMADITSTSQIRITNAFPSTVSVSWLSIGH